MINPMADRLPYIDIHAGDDAQPIPNVAEHFILVPVFHLQSCIDFGRFDPLDMLIQLSSASPSACLRNFWNRVKDSLNPSPQLVRFCEAAGKVTALIVSMPSLKGGRKACPTRMNPMPAPASKTGDVRKRIMTFSHE